MSEAALKEYIQPYPGIGGYIFAPPATGESRTWIFRCTEDPKTVLDFHFSSLMTQGWRVLKLAPALVAEKSGSSVSVSSLRRSDETRIIYEVFSGARP